MQDPVTQLKIRMCDELKKELKKRGMTQCQAACLFHTHQSYLSRLLGGKEKTATLDVLIRMFYKLELQIVIMADGACEYFPIGFKIIR